MKTKMKPKGRVEDYDKEIGIRLRVLRKLNNYTQDVLAKKLDITFQQVQKYEQGTNRISAGKIKQIIDIFDVPSAYFFEENKNTKKVGFAEGEQAPFEGADGTSEGKTNKVDIFQTTETINLLRSYYSVKDPKARKGMYKMIKTYAENIDNATKS